MDNNFYNFEANSLSGKPIQMSEYKDKVIIIVNTASKCGWTSQYIELEELYKKYKDKGLVNLGFPCNQFGNQEPGTEKEIAEDCFINYGVSFQMFSKIEVNGDNAHPIFKFLQNELSGIFGNRIKWNFTKFVLDRNGKPYKRIGPITSPLTLEKYIKKLL